MPGRDSTVAGPTLGCSSTRASDPAAVEEVDGRRQSAPARRPEAARSLSSPGWPGCRPVSRAAPRSSTITARIRASTGVRRRAGGPCAGEYAGAALGERLPGQRSRRAQARSSTRGGAARRGCRRRPLITLGVGHGRAVRKVDACPPGCRRTLYAGLCGRAPNGTGWWNWMACSGLSAFQRMRRAWSQQVSDGVRADEPQHTGVELCGVAVEHVAGCPRDGQLVRVGHQLGQAVSHRLDVRG